MENPADALDDARMMELNTTITKQVAASDIRFSFSFAPPGNRAQRSNAKKLNVDRSSSVNAQPNSKKPAKPRKGKKKTQQPYISAKDRALRERSNLEAYFRERQKNPDLQEAEREKVREWKRRTCKSKE